MSGQVVGPALHQPAEISCRTAASRVQKIVSSKPASPRRAAALQPTEADCLTGASRVQRTVAKTDQLPTRSSPASDRSRLPDGGQTAIYVPYLDRGPITR